VYLLLKIDLRTCCMYLLFKVYLRTCCMYLLFKVYLSHNNDPVAYETPDIVEEVPGIRQLHGSFAELLDGRRLEPDVILMATGYRYLLYQLLASSIL